MRLAAPVTGAGTSPASAHPSSSAPVEAIARRAFELYEREGRHDGRDLEYWLRAEAELGGRSQA